MSAGILVALTGPTEGALVKAVDSGGSGVQVVRRCADVPEVLAAAAAGLGSVAVLAADLPGVDRTTVGRLRSVGVRTLLVARARDVERCAALGADAVQPDDAPLGVLAAAVVALAHDGAPAGRPPRPGVPKATNGPGAGVEGAPGGTASRGGASTSHAPGGSAGSAGSSGSSGSSGGSGGPGSSGGGPGAGTSATAPADAAEDQAQDAAPPTERGRLVVVWGPPGAPGRTTVAVTLAAELAALAGGALLLDADTEAPSIAQVLGLLDDSSALAVAARQATHGRLDAAALTQLAPVLAGGLRVLTGLTRADRWRELPATALEVIWDVAREVSPWTVVDVGAGLGVEAGFDPAWAPQRHQATAAALAAADVVVVVGAGEPVGLRRLVLALGELSDRALPGSQAERVVLVNRIRASAAGPRPAQSVTEALARFAGVTDPLLVPDDRPATDRAVLQGRTLTEVAASSPARLVLHELARRLTGAGPARRIRRRAGGQVAARLTVAAHAR
ncbi:MAG: hypothetical protein ACYC1Z_09710 [Georgenia sp.]